LSQPELTAEEQTAVEMRTLRPELLDEKQLRKALFWRRLLGFRYFLLFSPLRVAIFSILAIATLFPFNNKHS
jgi:hypothetical protein